MVGDDVDVAVVRAEPVGLSAALLLARAGLDVVLLERRPGPVTDTSTFRTHGRLAAHDGRRRVLLIGDAAHVCSPIGGQGLDLGLRDAVSLASALPAATARGGPADARPAARRRTRRADAPGVLARTDLATRAWTLRSAPARAVRDTAVRGALTTAAGRRLLAEAVAGPRPD